MSLIFPAHFRAGRTRFMRASDKTLAFRDNVRETNKPSAMRQCRRNGEVLKYESPLQRVVIDFQGSGTKTFDSE